MRIIVAAIVSSASCDGGFIKSLSSLPYLRKRKRNADESVCTISDNASSGESLKERLELTAVTTPIWRGDMSKVGDFLAYSGRVIGAP